MRKVCRRTFKTVHTTISRNLNSTSCHYYYSGRFVKSFSRHYKYLSNAKIISMKKSGLKSMNSSKFYSSDATDANINSNSEIMEQQEEELNVMIDQNFERFIKQNPVIKSVRAARRYYDENGKLTGKWEKFIRETIQFVLRSSDTEDEMTQLDLTSKQPQIALNKILRDLTLNETPELALELYLAIQPHLPLHYNCTSAVLRACIFSSNWKLGFKVIDSLKHSRFPKDERLDEYWKSKLLRYKMNLYIQGQCTQAMQDTFDQISDLSNEDFAPLNARVHFESTTYESFQYLV